MPPNDALIEQVVHLREQVAVLNAKTDDNDVVLRAIQADVKALERAQTAHLSSSQGVRDMRALIISLVSISIAILLAFFKIASAI